MSFTFKGGVHPPANKEFSDRKNVEYMPPPQTVYIPLSQHIGKPAKAIVAVGDKVAEGQKIGEADGFVSVPVFSSVCGTVKAVENRATAFGKCKHIVIERSSDEEAPAAFRIPPLDSRDGASILRRIQESGIVGMGGAGFPVHVKLSPKEKIDKFIINAAECEPYITCDYRIMLEYTEQFLRGALYMAKTVGLDKAIVGIESNKTDAADFVSRVAKEKGYNVEVAVLKTKYPQGAEKQLIYAMTGRVVKAGGLPSGVGVIVSNVHTALSVALAVEDGQPLYKRIMTVTGDAVEEPKNFWCFTGTTYDDAVNFCGGAKTGEDAPVKCLNGGPMMGVSVSDETIACTRTTSCILLLGKKSAFTGNSMPCINCGKCASACPMKLMPMYIDSYMRTGDLKGAVKYGAKYCIGCGCCAYVCPAKRPLLQSIKLAKKKSMEAKL